MGCREFRYVNRDNQPGSCSWCKQLLTGSHGNSKSVSVSQVPSDGVRRLLSNQYTGAELETEEKKRVELRHAFKPAAGARMQREREEGGGAGFKCSGWASVVPRLTPCTRLSASRFRWPLPFGVTQDEPAERSADKLDDGGPRIHSVVGDQTDKPAERELRGGHDSPGLTPAKGLHPFPPSTSRQSPRIPSGTDLGRSGASDSVPSAVIGTLRDWSPTGTGVCCVPRTWR
ncbi:hypothetical protein BaRGS_00010193 [Batillaria attramentaria]|uniref:Uncharacterized protein n=1 Tax=Batillaria attramentaria TaxID=370345 RepID=A0ABD0LGM2_9CAEN